VRCPNNRLVALRRVRQCPEIPFPPVILANRRFGNYVPLTREQYDCCHALVYLRRLPSPLGRIHDTADGVIENARAWPATLRNEHGARRVCSPRCGLHNVAHAPRRPRLALSKYAPLARPFHSRPRIWSKVLPGSRARRLARRGGTCIHTGSSRGRARRWRNANPALYAGSALFAWLTAVTAHIPLQRSWGRIALWTYVAGTLAALEIALASRRFGGRAMLAAAVPAGTTLVPLLLVPGRPPLSRGRSRRRSILPIRPRSSSSESRRRPGEGLGLCTGGVGRAPGLGPT
jgi:hypothetical protein